MCRAGRPYGKYATAPGRSCRRRRCTDRAVSTAGVIWRRQNVATPAIGSNTVHIRNSRELERNQPRATRKLIPDLRCDGVVARSAAPHQRQTARLPAVVSDAPRAHVRQARRAGYRSSVWLGAAIHDDFRCLARLRQPSLSSSNGVTFRCNHHHQAIPASTNRRLPQLKPFTRSTNSGGFPGLRSNAMYFEGKLGCFAGALFPAGMIAWL
jgi:hypothetical protein